MRILLDQPVRLGVTMDTTYLVRKIYHVKHALVTSRVTGTIQFLSAKVNTERCKTFFCIQLFRERLSEEMRTRQSRKVIWDMINTLFVTTEAVEPTFVAFL